MTHAEPDAALLANAAMKGGVFDWEDALRLCDLLSEDEIAIRYRAGLCRKQPHAAHPRGQSQRDL